MRAAVAAAATAATKIAAQNLAEAQTMIAPKQSQSSHEKWWAVIYKCLRIVIGGCAVASLLTRINTIGISDACLLPRMIEPMTRSQLPISSAA
jgi:hypothetical protein